MLLNFLILTLATWRISSLLVDPEDDGPWDMFGKFRQLMGVKYDEQTGIYYGRNFIAQALLCVWCSSVYVGTAFTIGHFIEPDVTFIIAFPFALSTGAIVIDRLVNNG